MFDIGGAVRAGILQREEDALYRISKPKRSVKRLSAKRSRNPAPAPATAPAIATSVGQRNMSVGEYQNYLHIKKERLDMLRRIHDTRDNILDPPCTMHCDGFEMGICPYSMGSLMEQRYYLMKRLYQINITLFGQPKDGEPLGHLLI